MEKNKVTRVCVTGGSGYIGCWLVKKLLEKGHTVHATLRNSSLSLFVIASSIYVCVYVQPLLLSYALEILLNFSEDASKVGLLKSLLNADTNLFLFQADIYDPNEFEPAIQGCEFVFHVATPMQHNPTQSSQVSLLICTLISC